MKLIYRANSLEEANEIKSLLENAGIPAMISGENFSALRIPFFPGNQGVFIYLDEQYNDAIQLISDPEFTPTSAIDINEFYELLDSDEFRHNLNKGYLAVFSWFVLIIFVLFLLLNYLLY